MTHIRFIFFSFAVAAAAICWQAFVFKTLWLWFAVPFGLPALSLAAAAGLRLAFMALGRAPDAVRPDAETNVAFVLLRSFAVPAVQLVVGAVIAQAA